jgi:hypothetical protein
MEVDTEDRDRLRALGQVRPRQVRTLVVGKIDLPLRAGLTERVLGGDEITIVETVAAELHDAEISTVGSRCQSVSLSGSASVGTRFGASATL